ncbi:molecular chaperone DjlA [Sulfitobacter sp. HI0082]|jgi:DnaJ like chaperone protein|uniref:molecular chaperone DjiA n=1 Tax=Sulfitobacter TaxID=60136 RepID=UPI0007C22DEB|nr:MULTISPECIES: molecular chaperone DjiA [Sulfitobacter]KZZ28665.1 molecular chaperone DjlA [Sulfitobacter sp. HI0082]KZX91223.1 molecular chaperone DjlA [Sulfitobacter sp. HI0021]KZY02500.1 molecular chaperone DjlA [Sulfitobacter sp. HI0027]KZZ01148.1 molecular chaperone DjlA [Sulfitobacter sp. HI0076]WPZ30381.1 molecular chaperone DjiA [Sulfitobacter sp. OXR-159]|tara:strand:- start:80 stop:760 length:681 start_codon:yes stop_codon:yes gene_type:complete
MSIWTRISEALSALTAGEGLSAVFDRLRSPPERSVAFTIAVIALGAKMAKADGLVTRDEVTAFREVFQIAEGDQDGAARVFNLARQDVTGFEEYAKRIASMFNDQPEMLHDLMEGLFHIAMADGIYHPNENAFLEDVAAIFGMGEEAFASLKARFVPDSSPLPRTVLGIGPHATLEEARKAWRRLVRENHPDALVARGLPQEAIKMAEKRMIDINRAWETISGKHA